MIGLIGLVVAVSLALPLAARLLRSSPFPGRLSLAAAAAAAEQRVATRTARRAGRLPSGRSVAVYGGGSRGRRRSGPLRMHSRLMRLLTAIVSIASLLPPLQIARAAVAAGYSEYYVPGSSDQLWDIFEDLDDNPELVEAEGLHAVIAVTGATDHSTIYYDHWEDGYDFDPDNPEATADEIHYVDRGDVAEFESSNVPVRPRGTHVYYDGRDRIYVAGGAVTVTRASWPESIGTVFALAWELYPTKPFMTDYAIPVGEDLALAPYLYDDFASVYVIAQATTDGTIVQIDDPTTPGIDIQETLGEGGVTQLYGVDAGTTVAATEPVQVQFIVGQGASGEASEIRGYSAVPSQLWDNEYYSPVGSFQRTDSYDDPLTNLYLYNPSSAAIVIHYEDQGGSGSFTIPALSTRSYEDGAGRFVPVDSGVYLSSDDVFWGIGSADTEYYGWDWGYSLVPAFALTQEYYLGWAPGSRDAIPTDNGSPAFVTPVRDDTIVYVDFSPNDGVPDETHILNRLDIVKIFDPDDENTGMRIWSNGPIAVAWGEDGSTAGATNPYLDLGYTTLPLPESWIDPVLAIRKTVEPGSLPLGAGQVATFTLGIPAYEHTVDDVVVTDTLPSGWDYVAGTAVITLPDSTVLSGAAADPIITGQDLYWDLFQDMDPTDIMTITFEAQTTVDADPGHNRNDAVSQGRRGDQVFTAFDSAHIYLNQLTIDKDTTTPVVDAGGVATYTIKLHNESAVPIYDAVVTDTLPSGFTLLASSAATDANATRTSVDDPISGTGTPVWGTWTISSTGRVTITFSVDVATSVRSGTYDNTPFAWYWTASEPDGLEMNDAGTVAQDGDTPDGEDPEDDEDVTVVGAQLTIDKDTTTPVVGAGGVATYTIALHNPGTITATGVVVTDTVPAGFTFDGYSVAEAGANRTAVSEPTAGDRDLDWGTWEIYPGGRVTITFGCDVATSVTPGTYENTALANSVETGLIDDSGPTGQDADTPPGEDPEEDEDVTITPLLTIDKDTTTPVVEAGGVATYTIVLHNTGGTAATNVIVSDTLPSGFTYAGGTEVESNATRSPLTPDPSPPDAVLRWGTWDIDVGGAVTITFSVDIDTSVAPGTYDNTAEAVSDETGFIDDNGVFGQDPGTPDGEDPEEDEDVTVTSILSIDKDTSTPTVVAGGVATYTIALTNPGSVTVTNVVVSDTLPSGFTHAASGYSAIGATRTITSEPAVGYSTLNWGTWDIGGGGALTITFSANVAISTTPGTYDNTALAASSETGCIDDDGLVAQDSSTPAGQDPENDEDVIVVAPPPELSIEKASSAGGGPVNPGDRITYTVVVSNTGPGPATSVTVSDTVPLGTAYVSGSSHITAPIEMTATVRDEFDIQSYSNSDGTDPWDTDWIETDSDGGGATGGDIWIDAGGYLVMQANSTTEYDLIERESGLTGYDSATLSFIYDNAGYMEPSDIVSVEVSGDGGSSWVLLELLEGLDELPDDGAGGPFPRSYDITDYMSTQTRVRFGQLQFEGIYEFFYVNELQIEYAGRALTSTTAGSPPALVVAGDGYSLEPGETMTVTFAVTVDDPLAPGITEIVNTAEVDCTELDPLTDTVTDTVAFVPATIGDRVWDDEDGDGVQDGGESGLQNVRVYLDLNGNGSYDGGEPNDQTNLSGAYDITGLAAGTYTVTVDATTLAVGYVGTTADPLTVTVAAGEDYDDADFGFWQAPGIEVEKTATPGSTGRNIPITYTIRITNTGDVTLDPVSLVDTLPAEFYYVGPGTPSDPDLIAGQVLTWLDLGSLDPGESTTVSFPVTATPGIAGTYWNVVTATGTTPGGDVSDTDSAAVDIEDPAVAVEKTLVGYDTDILAPNYVTFTIAITNTGLTTIDELPLLDQYNTWYLSFHDATPYPDEPADDGLLTWYDLTGPAPYGFGSDLAPGQVVELTTVFRVAHDIDITTTNVVTVTGATDIYDFPTNDDDDEESVPGDPGIPTPVELLYFRAEAQGGGVLLRWASGAEIHLEGFYIYRGLSMDLDDARVVGYVAAKGGDSSYEFTDRDVAPRTLYRYWLVEAVSKSVPDKYGPVSTYVGADLLPQRVYLPLVIKGNR